MLCSGSCCLLRVCWRMAGVLGARKCVSLRPLGGTMSPFPLVFCVWLGCLLFPFPDQWFCRPGGCRAMSGGHLLLPQLGVLLAASGWGAGMPPNTLGCPGLPHGEPSQCPQRGVKPSPGPVFLHQPERHTRGWGMNSRDHVKVLQGEERALRNLSSGI